jgi:hypothetical protein
MSRRRRTEAQVIAALKQVEAGRAAEEAGGRARSAKHSPHGSPSMSSSGWQACYAQWEDVGPFHTDSAGYVFGDERPSPNVNHGAGIDVSPAVRDYLGLGPLDMVDWRFVEQATVPNGPWSLYDHAKLCVTAAHWVGFTLGVGCNPTDSPVVLDHN